MSFQAAIAALNESMSAAPRPDVTTLPPALRRAAKFNRLLDYIQTLDMEEPLSHLSVIHVAGTKGKGSTCAFIERILRSCGYRTGLFTSPHLLDIRERFRFNGVQVSEEVFAKHFWWCWDRIQARGLQMPGFFPFLTLLALKMFAAEHVDVAILEAGLGGRYDSTNIIQSPAVCGIASLGLDHMEVLGYTLAEIASEKAGIFKAGVPAFSVPQLPEAMEVLQEQANRLSVSLAVAPALESFSPDHVELGLEGCHQRVNAALAVALCASWEKKRGSHKHSTLLEQKHLPDAYLEGLATASWPGRAQVIHDSLGDDNSLNGEAVGNLKKTGSLAFYIDGAHSPESMEACARWFCSAVTLEKRSNKEEPICNAHCGQSVSPNMHCQRSNGFSAETCEENVQTQRVLLFNCMPKRDPQLLLPRLINTCHQKGIHINAAVFVAPFSSTTSIETRSFADICSSTVDTQPDLSWQKVLQNTWESLQKLNQNGSSFAQAQATKIMEPPAGLGSLMGGNHGNLDHRCSVGPSSVVMPSLPTAVNWLRHWASGKHVRLQVLVTGSLYLVGDLLRILKQNQTEAT